MKDMKSIGTKMMKAGCALMFLSVAVPVVIFLGILLWVVIKGAF